jgi:hypothetical protein
LGLIFKIIYVNLYYYINILITNIGEKAMEITNELKAVNFHRLHQLKRPKADDLPTLADTDEYKLPALNRLLLQMLEFNREMTSFGLVLRIDENSQSQQKQIYRLTDTRFKGHGDLEIILASRWFDPDHPFALHAGFKFYLYIEQKIHPKISDWLSISIRHLNVMPLSFVSTREHDRYLVPLFYRGKCFFDDIPLGPKERNFTNLNDGLTFNIKTFNQCVDDACAIMQVLIASKDNLVAMP